MKKVLVLVGPTAVGKTDLSIEIAKRYHTDIINGDSTQVYKELTIGTAKITNEEKQGITHHLIDIKEPTDTYDVETYQKDVRNLIEELDRPFVVGGTGFYIKAALDDYDFSGPKRNINEENKFSDFTNEELYEILIKKDPETAKNLHPNNRRRVLRAILLSDEYKRSLKVDKDKPLYDYLIIYLAMDRKELYQRINDRAEEILNRGFINEVKSLREKGVKPNVLGYREINQYLDGISTLDEAIELMKRNTRRYAKRQETFFKNQMQIKIIKKDDNSLNEIYKLIDKFW